MGAEFTRVENGVSAAELFRDLAKPTKIGTILTLSSADSGASAGVEVFERADGEPVYKAIVKFPDDSPTSMFESYSPEAIVDFVLDEYAK